VESVGVNGVTGTFTLSGEPTTSPAPTAEPGIISGVVWQDYCILVCTLSGDNQPSGGCVQDDAGSYRADGMFDDGEACISGVQVILSAGACPGGEVLASDTTDDSGMYAFTDLLAGTYCVGIDSLGEQNFSLLMPGGWTYPGDDVGYATVTLDEGEAKTGVDFGWDPQFK